MLYNYNIKRLTYILIKIVLKYYFVIKADRLFRGDIKQKKQIILFKMPRPLNYRLSFFETMRPKSDTEF